MTSPAKTGYAQVSGLKLYYDVHGSGEPLIVLHGGLGSLEMLAELLPEFSRARKVIARLGHFARLHALQHLRNACLGADGHALS